MEKKKRYEEAEAEIIRFEAEDVITASGGGIKTDEEALPSVRRMFNLF